jgi:hypothetical protein
VDVVVTEEASGEGLIGTWDLVTVNGNPIIPGVFLTWTFTETTLTTSSDLDCVDVSSYSIDGDMLVFTFISQAGTQCDPDVSPGDTDSLEFSLTASTLTVVDHDPDLGTGVFVFARR